MGDTAAGISILEASTFQSVTLIAESCSVTSLSGSNVYGIVVSLEGTTIDSLTVIAESLSVSGMGYFVDGFAIYSGHIQQLYLNMSNSIISTNDGQYAAGVSFTIPSISDSMISVTASVIESTGGASISGVTFWDFNNFISFSFNFCYKSYY